MIAKRVLGREYWARNPKAADLLELMLDRGSLHTWNAVARHVLGQKHWAEHPRGADLLAKLIGGRSSVHHPEYDRQARLGARALDAEHPKGADLHRVADRKSRSTTNVRRRSPDTS